MQIELLVVGAVVYSQCFVLFQNARFAEIRCHDGVAKEVRASADVEIATRSVSIVFGNGINPINVGIEVGVIVAACAIDLSLGERLHLTVLIGQLIEQLWEHRWLVYRLLKMEFHRRRTYFAMLGGYDNYTICSTNSIHGTGRSIFQDRERLNLRGGNVVQISFDTIYEHERIVAA